MNAVLVMGNMLGPTLYYGAGAGSEPTASAVVTDVIDLGRVTTDSKPSYNVPAYGFQNSEIKDSWTTASTQRALRQSLAVHIPSL